MAATRASDAERDSAARALRHHYSAGRLDERELEQRLSLVYAAKERRELRRLLRDLPRPFVTRRQASAMHRAALTAHGWTFLFVNGGLVGAWLATGGGEFWPALGMVPSGALLGWHAVRVRAIGRASVRRSAGRPAARP